MLLAHFASAQDFKKNEFGAFSGVYESGELPNTVAYGQQYTRWVNKNIGVSIGTFRTNQEILPNGDLPSELVKTQQEAHRYWDLTLKSRFSLGKSSLGAAGGVSADRFYQSRFIQVTDIPNQRLPLFDSNLSVSTKPAVHLELNYGYQFTPNISVKVFAREYAGQQRAGFYGANLSYHFDANRDSLGISTNNKTDFGIVSGGGFVGALGGSPNGYRVLLPYAGIYFQREISVAWDARVELLYARRGFTSREIEAGNTTYLATKFRADFVQIPILFENEFIPNWSLYFGPHFSFMINNDYEIDGDKRDIPNTNGLTFGLTAGLSRTLTNRLSLETRYALDFLSFSPYTYANTLNDFRLGLRFRVN